MKTPKLWRRQIFSLTCLVVIVWLSQSSLVLADGPSIVSFLLNQSNQDVCLNPQLPDAKVNISLSADRPVKYSTIAICATGDEVCSRQSAVKYFTQTSLNQTVSKEWDGQTGGASPVPVSDGRYWLKVTIKDDSDQEAIISLVSPTIIIDSASSETTTTSGVSETPSLVSVGGSVNVAGKKLTWSIISDALVIAKLPVRFSVRPSNSGTSLGQINWNFGDGLTAVGEAVEHDYAFPGEYLVTASFSSGGDRQVIKNKFNVLAEGVIIQKIDLAQDLLEIKNRSAQEIDLSSWRLVSGQQSFIFPANSFLGANASLRLAPTRLGLSLAEGETCQLYRPDGQLIFSSQLAIGPENLARLEQALIGLRQQYHQAISRRQKKIAVAPVMVSVSTTPAFDFSSQSAIMSRPSFNPAPDRWRWLKQVLSF